MECHVAEGGHRSTQSSRDWTEPSRLSLAPSPAPVLSSVSEQKEEKEQEEWVEDEVESEGESGTKESFLHHRQVEFLQFATTRSSGRYAALLLAPAESWCPLGPPNVFL